MTQVFTHDTVLTLRSTAALINADDLDTVGALQDFLDEYEFSGRRDRDRAEVDAVLALRPRLRLLWTAPDDERVAEVNALLAEAGALPQLVRHDGWDYHLHAVSSDSPVATRVAVETAMALVDVIRAGETARLLTCAAEDCDGVLVDLSRNRSRRFCDGGCGNRVAAAAYRARRRPTLAP